MGPAVKHYSPTWSSFAICFLIINSRCFLDLAFQILSFVVVNYGLVSSLGKLGVSVFCFLLKFLRLDSFLTFCFCDADEHEKLFIWHFFAPFFIFHNIIHFAACWWQLSYKKLFVQIFWNLACWQIILWCSTNWYFKNRLDLSCLC